MAIEQAMALTNRLLSRAQALGAVTAYLRLAGDGNQADPELRARLERIIDVLDARAALDALTDDERAIVTSFARSYMHQALELMEDPARPSAWSHSDPTILQAQGAASAVVAKLFAGAGLGGPGVRILDIGTGVGRLAIAFCQHFPDSTVVGVDPWEPALSLARKNVSGAGLDDRIALRSAPIQAFEDGDGFDLIWLPSFFIPMAVLDEAFRRAGEFLRPGGTLVVGVFEGPDDPLAQAVDAMITVRSGGAALEPQEAVSLLQGAGFGEVREVERTWQAPLRLVAARHRAA
jgi:cyclopropane fatty-acyl-phospholipid synthase-like methyltransferase